MITGLILVGALVVLGMGFPRARAMGKLGLLAWLQSVVLIAPWLLFFGLVSAGVFLNLAAVLLLIVLSIGLYVLLGNRLRSLGQDFVSQELSQSPAAEPALLPPTEPAAPPAAAAAEAKISTEDLLAVQSIFEIDTFFVTETLPYQEGAIFKGNLRGEVMSTYGRLTRRLQERLGDRYRLFLLNGADNRPTVVVLPKTSDPPPTTLTQKLLAVTLALITAGTCLETAGLLQGFDVSADPQRLSETLPIALGIVLVLALHELGHRLVARRYQIKLSPPFWIPTLQIGSFGSLVRFESPLGDRSQLFDIAVAGPLAGGLAAFILLLIGLSLSHQGSVFQIPSDFFQGSILVGTLARVVLGDVLQESLVDVHPLVVVGWIGLVITALNLMPAGQLDGGRVVQAIYGRKVAGRATVATLIVLGVVSLANPLALYWAVLILFLQRDLERPALNDLVEPNDSRAALGLLVLFLMAATLLPLAPGLAGRLGIGG